MSDLAEFAKQQMRIAQKMMLVQGGLMPILVFDSEKGTGLVSVPDYGNPDAKESLREIMQMVLERENATRYAFVCEAWIGTKKTMPEPGYRPSQDPERQECITVAAADKAGTKIFMSCEIKRLEDGIMFSEPAVLDGLGGGPVMELFGQETRH